MRTISLNHLSENLPVVLMTSAKAILAFLFLLYAVFHFSASQWLFSGLFSVAVLAIMHRISRMDTNSHTDEMTKAKIIATDGGTFRHIERNKQVRNSGPIVYDGGIVKHKASK